MKKILFLLLIISNILSAQDNKIDSLLKVIKTTKNDSIKVDAYNKLVWKYLFNDKVKALEILDKTEKLALKTNQKYGYNTFLNSKGIYYDVNGLSDSAIIYFKKALGYSIANKFTTQEQYSHNNIGMYSWNKGMYQDALNSFFKSLKLAEINIKTDSTIKMDGALNNIGLIYQEMELYEKAIPYHQRALKIRSARHNPQGESSSYNNLGICYKHVNKIEEAKIFFKKGIEKANEAGDKMSYYHNLSGLANAYAFENKHQKALDLFLETYNRPENVPFSSKDKVSTLSSISTIYLNLDLPFKSIEYGKLCLIELKNQNADEFYELGVFKTLAQAYFVTGNIDKGNFYSQMFYDKTIEKFKESSAKSLQEVEVKYETEKKELALIHAKNENLIKEASIQKKNYLLYAAFGLAFLLAFIGFLFYKQQKLKNVQLVRESELNQAIIIMETQNKLQKQRLEISRELHDNIGSQLTFIISSVDNLKFYNLSKEAILDKYDKISGFTRNTITELRDSIWAMNKEEITFEDLKTRTANFIENAKISLQGIDFKFTYPSEHELIVLNSKTGIYIYRIIQEAVNNAIKHANATEIKVSIEGENQQFVIQISDNGSGFDIVTVEKSNGLQSLENRANEIGAKLAFGSDKGTQIKLIIPKA